MNINEENKINFMIDKNKIKKKLIINIEDINNFPLNKFNKLKIIPKLIKISNNKTLNNKNNFNKFSLEQLKNLNNTKKYNFIDDKKFIIKKIIDKNKNLSNKKIIFQYQKKHNYKSFSNFSFNKTNRNEIFYKKNYISNKNIKHIENFDESFNDDLFNILYDFDKSKIFNYYSINENKENIKESIIENKLNQAFDNKEKQNIEEKIKTKYIVFFKQKKVK